MRLSTNCGGRNGATAPQHGWYWVNKIAVAYAFSAKAAYAQRYTPWLNVRERKVVPSITQGSKEIRKGLANEFLVLLLCAG